VAYDTGEARQELLNDVATAIDRIAVALAAMGEAYEQLDERSADRLEEELFRPLQLAYGRAKRTHTEFAHRYDLPQGAFTAAPQALLSTGVKGFIDSAVRSVGEADTALAQLQDSMRPVEVGDAELRAGLSEVRRLIGEVPGRARQFVRVLGR
jgi:hypothetical protein